MKRILVLLCIFLITGCSELEHSELPEQPQVTVENENHPAPLLDEDFAVKSDNTIIELGMDYKSLKTDEKITHARYANERRAYNTVIYENFMVSYGLSVFEFALITPVHELPRRVKVGDCILDVFEKYGIGEEIQKTDYQYKQYRYSNNDKDWSNRKAMKFFVDENGIITRIQFEFDHA